MADLLTTVRLLLAAPVAWAMADEELLPAWAALAMVLAAAASDFFDGRLARARGTASERGRLFDHGADCLFVTAALAGAAAAGALPWALPVLTALAFAQYVLDSFLLHRRKTLRASFLGRWNGVLYFAPVAMLAGARALDGGAGGALAEGARWLALALIVSTLVSIGDRALAPRGSG